MRPDKTIMNTTVPLLTKTEYSTLCMLRIYGSIDSKSAPKQLKLTMSRLIKKGLVEKQSGFWKEKK